jgi:hypothetical protein
MEVALRGVVYSLVILVSGVAASLAGDAPANAAASKKAAGYANPKSTFRTYIEAVRKNDASAAKKCWVLDDDDKFGALDVVVGRNIALRRLRQVAAEKFGKEGAQAVPEDWRLEKVTDEALDLTKKRLDKAEVRIKGDKASLEIKRDKGEKRPAFEDYREPIPFRKVGEDWKIDFNQLVGTGARFLDATAIPPIGLIFAGHAVIANEAVDRVKKGKLKSAKELKDFIDQRWNAWPEEYAGWLKKHIEERKKADSKPK